jgi:hypothetical protein
VSLKNVLRLHGVYSKSYRLIARGKFRNYKDSRWKNYAGYALLLLLGVAIGSLIALAIGSAGTRDSPDDLKSIRDAAAGIFVALPVIAILYSLYFTQMSQIQRMGANVAVQPIYWFPLTWEEHTLASILTSMTMPLVITLILIPIILIPSYVIGLLPLGVLTIAALVAGMALTGATSEILKGVQIKVVAALSKRAGRLTVWIRFLATLGLFTLVYVFYFAINRADIMGLVNSLANGIMLAWFVPYLWPGIVLNEVYRGAWPEAALFTVAVGVFAWALYRLAVRSNEKYALQDSQVIRISGGAYVPKRGLLERLGISTAVAAVMRKDLRAYTRRQELMYVFIMPIVFVVSTLMPIVAGGRGATSGPDTFSFFYLSLEPAVVLALFLGCSIVGSEGERRWFLIMSPLSVRSFVRAKYLFCALISAVVALASVAIASLIFPATPYMIATGIVESLLLTFSIGMVALAFGIRGADFREAIKQQSIRPRWMFACMIVSVLLTLIIVMPVLAYGGAGVINDISPGLLPSPVPHTYLVAAWAVSGLLALAVAFAFYVLAVRFAGEMFKKTDT